MESARCQRVDPPAETVEDLREGFRFRDFPYFISIDKVVGACLATPEDSELVSDEPGAELARPNVRDAEFTFPPGRLASPMFSSLFGSIVIGLGSPKRARRL